jgi:hypothetical protein
VAVSPVLSAEILACNEWCCHLSAFYVHEAKSAEQQPQATPRLDLLHFFVWVALRPPVRPPYFFSFQAHPLARPNLSRRVQSRAP